MASPRALVIKINSTMAEFSESIEALTKRVAALEAAIEQRNAPKPPAKRRRPKKAA